MSEVKKRPQYIIVRDNFVLGIIGDLFMYGCLGALYYLNYKYLGNSWILDLIMTFLAIGMVVNVFSHKHRHTFYSYEEALRWLQDKVDYDD